MVKIHEGPAALTRLAQLGLSKERLEIALQLAAGDARLCTRFDSPAQAAITFWSRSNRYIREEYIPLGWRYTNAESVLRTFYPDRTHCITAMSGSGGVGDPTAKVRARNPKGGVVRATVERNEQLELALDLPAIEGEGDIPADGIPTWFLLYAWSDRGIEWEISYPVAFDGNYPALFSERIIPGVIPWDGDPLVSTPDVEAIGDADSIDFDVEYTG